MFCEKQNSKDIVKRIMIPKCIIHIWLILLMFSISVFAQETYTWTTIAGSSLVGGHVDGIGTAASFAWPGGVALDSAGNIYVTDNSAIRKITVDRVVTTIAGGGTGLNGNIDGIGNSARFSDPYGIAVEASGEMYVADKGANTIRKMTRIGTNWNVTTFAGDPGSYGYIDNIDGSGSNARFLAPCGVASDNAGNIYIADRGHNTIRKISTSGAVVTTIAGAYNGSGSSCSVDGIGSSARFCTPHGVAVDSAHNVYVADRHNNAIRKITSSGVVTTIAGSPDVGGGGSSDGIGSLARFRQPTGIAIDSAGSLYVADNNNNTVRKLKLVGVDWVVSTIGGVAGYSGNVDGTNSNARFHGLEGVAVDSGENVYVTDSGNGTIRLGMIVQTLGSLQVTLGPVGAVTAGAQWQVDGGAWQNSGAIVSGLTIGNHSLAFKSLSGWTTPTIQNATIVSGQTAIHSATYNVVPTITQQPQSQIVAVGTNVTFFVTVSSTDTLVYKWQKDGINLTGATNANYIIDSVQSIHAGNYSVVISVENTSASITSSTVTLTVIFPGGPPSITQQPTNQTAILGADVSFQIIADSSVPMTYHWQFNSYDLNDTDRFCGSSTNSLVLSNAQLTDAGSYRVIISNKYGSVTSSVIDLILESPLRFDPSSLTLSIGRFNVALCSQTEGYVLIQVSTNMIIWTNLVALTNCKGVIPIFNANLNNRQFYRAVLNPPIIGPNMASIPAGKYIMGDDMGDGNLSELSTHSVYVRAFYMDRCEVTKAQWDGVYSWARTNGYSYDNAGTGKATNHPVQNVDWFACVKWCNARSEQEGRTPAYYTDAAMTAVYKTGNMAPYVRWNSGYRLPTEAEWEKAARGGLTGKRFPWGDTISWSEANYSAYPLSAGGYAYDVNYTSGVHPAFRTGVYPYSSPVGSFAPNGYGLYDMAGNVWEWCWDWYGSYSSTSQTDPQGPTGLTTGSDRVLRGGSLNNDADYCRAANRSRGYPNFRASYVGFRSVLPSALDGMARFTQQPQNQTNNVGDTAMLTCTVTGVEPMYYQWYKNGTAICGARTGSYTIVDVVTNDSGNYTVAVSNAFGSATSKVAILTVNGLPVLNGMALIPAGNFTMGDSLDGDTYAQPTHSVYVSAFYMDRCEVTKAQWVYVFQWAITNGYRFNNAGSGKAANHPVQTVGWYDCVKWCNARSEQEGRTPAYYTDAAMTAVYKTGQTDAPYVRWNVGYRIPTEAEWEKAARGGGERKAVSVGGHDFVE